MMSKIMSGLIAVTAIGICFGASGADVSVDWNTVVGKVKPVNGVGQPPLKGNAGYSMFQYLKKAGIPYSRLHDVGGPYGRNIFVDIPNLFRDFDADETKPENYDFTFTDKLMEALVAHGVEPFFRLGVTIENACRYKAYRTYPPKDFAKWARICEHVIRHYTEGWANGYKMKIEYWEIWNEPENHPVPELNPMFRAPFSEYIRLYGVTAPHLKAKFPHLKIGGPAIAYDLAWTDKFLAQINAPLDFFSWHCYSHSIEKMLERSGAVRALLDKYGFKATESILNEWNYVLGWTGDEIVYSHDQRTKIKGAAFTAAAMCACQYSSVDMLMYYDARPSIWNGMFDSTVVGRVLKGYYPFPMFDTLYRLGTCVGVSEIEDGGYACAARNEDEAAILATHFKDDDEAEAKNFSIDIAGFGTDSGTDVEIYLLDGTHDNTLVGKATYYGNRFSLKLDMPNFTCFLIKLKKTA